MKLDFESTFLTSQTLNYKLNHLYYKSVHVKPISKAVDGLHKLY